MQRMFALIKINVRLMFPWYITSTLCSLTLCNKAAKVANIYTTILKFEGYDIFVAMYVCRGWGKGG